MASSPIALGRDCTVCGTDSWTKNGKAAGLRCAECSRQKCRAYNLAHAEQHKAKARAYREAHRDVLCAAQRKRYHENKERDRPIWWARQGIVLTNEQYAEMLEAQGGVCAICKKTQPPGRKKRLEVDHNHETKKVRDLLCCRCNRLALNIDLVRAVLAYLERHEC